MTTKPEPIDMSPATDFAVRLEQILELNRLARYLAKFRPAPATAGASAERSRYGFAMAETKLNLREGLASRARQLLMKEKRLTRELDALAAKRRRLPMVEFEDKYKFAGARGPVTLLRSVRRPVAA